jgi:hypothetical protein
MTRYFAITSRRLASLLIMIDQPVSISRAEVPSIDRSIRERPLNEKGEKAPLLSLPLEPIPNARNMAPLLQRLHELLVTHCSSRPTRDKGFLCNPPSELEGILKQVQTCAHLDDLDAYSVDVSHPHAAFNNA